ncbi:hypothetical protein PAPYR_1127 [Paratrimastix pyriformis]|uniref:Uncharacterized protein n=1 Tax=Paratrimastix pyriformis TaxID=342808 RepID=A0ABQ8UWJ3_9EUKA|nr:hypothetical protein PAPYR_1127 [Paratrimastix pyriformis]
MGVEISNGCEEIFGLINIPEITDSFLQLPIVLDPGDRELWVWRAVLSSISSSLHITLVPSYYYGKSERQTKLVLLQFFTRKKAPGACLEPGSGFNRAAFTYFFLEMGLPGAVLLVPGVLLLAAVGWKLRLVASWLWTSPTRRRLFCLAGARRSVRCRTVSWVVAVGLLCGLVPVGLFVAWGIVSAAVLAPWIVGVTVALLSTALAACGWALMRWWQGDRWRLTAPALIGFIGFAVLFCIWQFLALFPGRASFSYMSVSSVFLSWNMLVVLYIPFLLTPDRLVDIRELVRPYLEKTLTSNPSGPAPVTPVGPATAAATATAAASAPSSGAAPRLDMGPLTQPPSRAAIKKKLLTALFLYLGSVGVLVAYAVVTLVLAQADPASLMSGGLGFVTAGTVVALDLLLSATLPHLPPFAPCFLT